MARRVAPVRRRRDLQRAANRLDPATSAVLVDEGVHFLRGGRAPPERNRRWPTSGSRWACAARGPRARATRCAAVGPASGQAVHRCHARLDAPDGRLLAFAGEPGRSLCQDVALMLEVPVLATQSRQLIALSAARDVRTANGLPTAGSSLRDPSRDALGTAVELTRKLRRRAPNLHQFDHPSAELRRTRGLRDRHVGLLPP